MRPPISEQITFLRTDKLEEMHEFYCDILGLPLALDQGGCRLYRVAENAYIGFCDRSAPTAPGEVMLTIVSPDVDAWHKLLAEKGIATDGEPRDNPDYRIYHFFADDPAGYKVEFQRFWDDPWDSTQK